MLIGYRYLHSSDKLGIATTATLTLVGGGVPAGTTFNVSDSFNAISNFHGQYASLDLRRSGRACGHQRWQLVAFDSPNVAGTRPQKAGAWS